MVERPRRTAGRALEARPVSSSHADFAAVGDEAGRRRSLVVLPGEVFALRSLRNGTWSGPIGMGLLLVLASVRSRREAQDWWDAVFLAGRR